MASSNYSDLPDRPRHYHHYYHGKPKVEYFEVGKAIRASFTLGMLGLAFTGIFFPVFAWIGWKMGGAGHWPN